MPTYVYEAAPGAKGCPACREGFEVFHGMNEPAPSVCPRCAGPIRRRLTAPGIVTRWNEKSTLSDANLKRHGFKKLVNEGDGKFKVTL
jgi:putative FmdB family regulatory protein